MLFFSIYSIYIYKLQKGFQELELFFYVPKIKSVMNNLINNQNYSTNEKDSIDNVMNLFE